jgi:heat shock protein HslJ
MDMRRALSILSIFTLLMVACADTDAGDDGQIPTDADADVEGDWELVGGTVDGVEFPLVAEYRVTMNLHEGKVGGTAACNSYGGEYTLQGWSITFGMLAKTEMACEPAVMDAEQAFMTVLGEPRTLSRDADTLQMMGDGVELEFRLITPVEPEALVGTVWMLETIIQGEAASSVQGEPSLVLNDDGTFVGATGCRSLTGRYQISGDELVITEMSADGECPAEFATQDSQIISVLEAPQVEVDGDRLRMTASGGEGLEYIAAG